MGYAAGWSDVFHLKPRDWVPFKGLSDQAKLLSLCAYCFLRRRCNADQH